MSLVFQILAFHLVVLDPASPTLCELPTERLLDAVIFAGNRNPVRDVMVGGQWVVCDGSHKDERAVLQGYRDAVKKLQDR